MKIIIIAGPNGAGKSTFAAEYLEREGAGRPFVNGDDIAAMLNPENPAAVAQEAGRQALRQMEAYVTDGVDFALETTLSGRAYATRIRRWQARGYRVAIIYLRLPSAEYAVERVAQRVAEGGHEIPEAVVRRRFVRSWTNFRELYREVADEWQVYDNSVRPPRLMQESRGCQVVREPRVAQSPSRGDFDAALKTADRGQQYPSIRRLQMTGQPGGFPEGEPAVKNVLAALLRAQERAMARAAARDGVDSSLASTNDATAATAPADLTSATSSAREIVDPRLGSNR